VIPVLSSPHYLASHLGSLAATAAEAPVSTPVQARKPLSPLFPWLLVGSIGLVTYLVMEALKDARRGN